MTTLGNAFTNGKLTDLQRRAIHRRAVEAVIWGMPAVNFDLLFQAMVREAHGAWNEIVYWSRLPDWKNQTLTPNPDTVYFFPFFNTKDAGPMVLEIPPADTGSITGSIMDAWQAALEDVGPAGADRGIGGKYLILPPGYEGKPPAGYTVLRSDTFAGFAVLRSNVRGESPADVAKAVAYAKRVKLYPFVQAANPPPTMFVDAADRIFDTTIPYDLRFFQSLDRFIQAEPWLERDKAMIDHLKAIGIEKGKRYAPHSWTKTILTEAVREAHAWLEEHYEAQFSEPYFTTSRWAVPVSRELIEGQANFFAKAGVYPTDERGVLFSFAFFSAKHLGSGQFYLMTIKDRAGHSLDGGNTYRLTVPAHVPANLYWSVTVYDRATHALIRDLPRYSRASNAPGIDTSIDGSVDLYFGPTAPAGKDTNWVPTRPGGSFEVLFRFYGPEKALFEKTWSLPDIEKIREPRSPARDKAPATTGFAGNGA